MPMYEVELKISLLALGTELEVLGWFSSLRTVAASQQEGRVTIWLSSLCMELMLSYLWVFSEHSSILSLIKNTFARLTANLKFSLA